MGGFVGGRVASTVLYAACEMNDERRRHGGRCPPDGATRAALRPACPVNAAFKAIALRESITLNAHSWASRTGGTSCGEGGHMEEIAPDFCSPPVRQRTEGDASKDGG